MSITIPANDHGQIRIFATDQPLPMEVLEKDADALAVLLGAEVDPDYVDVVRVADLNGMALTHYIAEGYDLPADPFGKDAIDRITGSAILVMSRAHEGREVTLTPAQGLHHVATLSREMEAVRHEPLPSEGARGVTGETPAPAPKSDARMGGMVAMAALAVLFLLVVIMIWIA